MTLRRKTGVCISCPAGIKWVPCGITIPSIARSRGERFDRSEAIPIEIKAGGILIFHSNLPHQTPINESPQRRRALQFHYRAADNPRIEAEAYKSIFVEKDGTPATCYAARPISSKTKI